ncbi:hypothetical protein UPF0182 [Methyloglobulus morosus KoM1]|uniref:Uncharacterized protein n=1 Tax=Methyloglobulus morosus KoM1 TaxID=1116472 RepID=V5BEE4_9GAMM|nr:UPF0182 family protein [Methyloglobulus morosus]ESS71640.1 hypothetical protein UPF0182 [Methyloglobulus morosus KoM1]
MRNLNLIPAVIFASIVISIVVFVAFHFIFLDLFVDLWWFQSIKLENYFWLRLLYKFFLSGGVTLFFFTIFLFHFWIASRYLGLNPQDEVLSNFDQNVKFQKFSEKFLYGSAKIYAPIALLLAIFIAVPFYNQWETTLLYFFGNRSNVAESVYGNDISFYLLSLPIYKLIQPELLSTAILIFIMVGVLYWLEHIFVPNQNKELHPGAKIHLGILIGFVVMFVVWGFLLQRFSLLYTDSHEPVFYGPGTIEIRYQLPLIWLGIVSFLAMAVMAGVYIFSDMHRNKTPFFISLATFLVIWGLPHVEFIPNFIQKYIVDPNPVKTEKSFIQQNIDATWDAYDLKNIKTVDLSINLNAAEDITTWSSQKRFENIPVWDREHLISSYKQLQEIRPYYQFINVDEDRYPILDHMHQVNLAAREINTSKLPDEAQNWENIHLRYTHGYGAVMSSAAQDADKPLVWYLRDLNMTTTVGLQVKYPDIYYGEGHYDYAIVPNKLNIVDISGSNPNTDLGISQVYHGEGGIPINSLFRKALLAIYLKEEKIFFSTNIGNDSKVKIYRNIADRVKKLTPFLHLDNDPYLVAEKDRFYWIQDAYTLSDKYPVSRLNEFEFPKDKQNFNYIRNSVKVVVDAYDGDLDFYISDPSDSIIEAYSNAYPGLFKPLKEMPEELRQHLRYPRDLYQLQMKVFAKYHQKTPEAFYEQGETWQFATVRDNPVMPYYQTMDFGNCNDQEEFVLINPMTPINRDNLSMIGLAGVLDKDKCNQDYKPGITVYKFAKDVQVNGPAQVEALINQNPEISANFTLWGQAGSTVEMGRMIILPMGKTVLYVQPIYLTSTKTKIPELTRVIVSIGDRLVIDTTLWSAFNRLKQFYLKDAADVKETGSTKAIVKPDGQ